MTEQVMIDWEAALLAVAQRDKVLLPAAVDPSVLTELLSVDLVWLELDEQLPSGVQQQYRFASIDPAANQVVGDFCAAVHNGLAAADRGKAIGRDFVLNEASFHRYEPDDGGLGRHRDMGFYHYLVIGVTLGGSGELHLFDADAVSEVWETRPGDLYLLRAPRFLGNKDRRPAHATVKNTGRTSLTLRYNTHGFGGGWPESG